MSAQKLFVAIDGSPSGKGRTDTVLRKVLTGAEEAGATATEVITVRDRDAADVCARIEEASGVVFGSPVYRASFAAPLKGMLDQLPRGMWGETRAPLQGKALAIAVTGASPHHFLALDHLRNVLATFFAGHVVPPGLYVDHAGFDEPGKLTTETASRASDQGRALVELSQALASSLTLKTLTPQV